MLQILNPSELPALHTYERARQHWNRARECKKSDKFSLDLTSSRTSWLQPRGTGYCADGFSINHSGSVPCLNFSVHSSSPTQLSNSWKSRNLWKWPVRKTSQNQVSAREQPGFETTSWRICLENGCITETTLWTWSLRNISVTTLSLSVTAFRGQLTVTASALLKLVPSECVWPAATNSHLDQKKMKTYHKKLYFTFQISSTFSHKKKWINKNFIPLKTTSCLAGNLAECNHDYFPRTAFLET